MSESYLTHDQIEALLRPLAPHRVSVADGQSHLEAWDIRAALTRVFGFGRWSLVETRPTTMLYETEGLTRGGAEAYTVAYRSTLRLTVHSPDGTLLAEFDGTAVGEAKMPSYKRGDAHDMAIKGLALDTPIPTPSGWTTMEALTPGDLVIDRDGNPVQVLSKSEVKQLPCYEVEFTNGDVIVCDNEHVWVATVAQEREKVHSIADLWEAKQAGRPVRVPIPAPLNLPPADLPMDPYVFGLWLGDGSRMEARITVGSRDLDHYEAAMRSAGIDPGKRQYDRRGDAVTVSMLGQRKVLAEMGALGDKAIPVEYLRGSTEQRLALLRGLMDSDGTAGRNRVSFSAKREAHARAVAELAHSLGERVRVSSAIRTGFGVTGTYWRVEWTPNIQPFALPRKAAKVRGRQNPVYNAVRRISEVPSVPTACISVDSPSKTYLAGYGMVPTHNTAESQALKRCAINLGTMFGLSLYSNGSTDDVVKVVLVRPEAPEVGA